MKKRFILTVIASSLLVLGCLILPCRLLEGRVIDGLLINISGNPVTFSEFREYISLKLNVSEGDADEYLRKEKSRAKIRSFIDAFINVMLVRFELVKRGEAVSEKEIDAVIQRIIKNNKITEVAFKDALSREGMTLKGYRANLREELEKSRIIRAMRGKEVTITDGELKNFFRENLERYMRHDNVDLEILSFSLPDTKRGGELVRFKEMLARADRLIAGGAGIKELAAYFHDRGVKYNRARTGLTPVDDLSGDIKKEVSNLERNTVSPATIIEDRVFYMALVERKGGEAIPFKEVKEKIREELTERRGLAAMKDIIKELRASAFLEVHL